MFQYVYNKENTTQCFSFFYRFAFMRKIKDLNKNERNMLIILCILIILTIINWKRVYNGIEEGFNKFFSAPAKVEQVK